MTNPFLVFNAEACQFDDIRTYSPDELALVLIEAEATEEFTLVDAVRAIQDGQTDRLLDEFA